jgi:RNA polymerase primary sigma factor
MKKKTGLPYKSASSSKPSGKGEVRYVLYDKKELPPLLTPKEEKELAHLIKNGSKEEGEAARTLFIESNLRLVIKIARSYEFLGVDFEDLVGEGNIGLMRAVDRFNPSKGAKFSTYASFWIRQRITRTLSNNSQLIRMPVYLKQIYLNIRKYHLAFQEENNRPPTIKETAKEFNVSEQKVADIQAATGVILHLDSILSGADGEEGSKVSDMVADEFALTASQEAETKSEYQALHNLLHKLNERERYIIKGRFGLLDGESMTLEAIGGKFKITRERIRQIELAALKKLKSMYRRQLEVNV